MSLESFPLFPKLPIELRRQIWTWSFPRPRTLYYAALQYQPKFTDRPSTSTRITKPAALSVNSESRQLALHYFSPPIDTRRDFLDFNFDYFEARSLPKKDEPREDWDIANDDLEKIANVVLDYGAFETCRQEFASTVSYFIDDLRLDLREVVLKFHIREPLLRVVGMEYWKVDEPIMTQEKSQDIMTPMKAFTEETLEKIRESKLAKGEIWRVPKVGLRDCGVCLTCVRLARCHAAQKAYRRRMARLAAEMAMKASEQGESSARGALGEASATNVHEAESSPMVPGQENGNSGHRHHPEA